MTAEEPVPTDESATHVVAQGTFDILHPGHVHYLRDAKAFDRKGEPRDLDVLDVSLPEGESFFDFTQADIDAELDYNFDEDADPS